MNDSIWDEFRGKTEEMMRLEKENKWSEIFELDQERFAMMDKYLETYDQEADPDGLIERLKEMLDLNSVLVDRARQKQADLEEKMKAYFEVRKASAIYKARQR